MAVSQNGAESFRPVDRMASLDLSFARFEQDAHVVLLPQDLAVLLVGVAARQALSPTAKAQVGIERHSAAETDSAFAPAHGAFSHSVAGLLAGAAHSDHPKSPGSEP